MTTPEWIKGRLPTAADGDSDGDVRIQERPDRRPDQRWLYQHYSLVVPGQPWWSPNVAASVEPVPNPERRIVQLAGMEGAIYALCDDGTAWGPNGYGDWEQLPPIPQLQS